MRNRELVLTGVLGVSDEELHQIFYADYGNPPSMKARANLFLQLPPEMGAKIFSAKFSGDSLTREFIVGECLRIENGPEKIITILKLLSAEDCYEIVFRFCGPITEESGILGALPWGRIATLLDLACEANNAFYGLRYFHHLSLGTRVAVLEQIGKGTFRDLMEKELLDKEKMTLINTALVLTVGRLATFCSELKPRRAYELLSASQDQEKVKAVINGLSSEFSEYFFSRKAKKGQTMELDEKKIDVRNLKRKDQIAFFQKFPRSKQLANLSLLEQVDAVY